MLILDNLLVVECDADNEGTEESGVGSGGMGVGDPLAWDLSTNACQLPAQLTSMWTTRDLQPQRRRRRDVWEALWLLQSSNSCTKEGKDRREMKMKREEEEYAQLSLITVDAQGLARRKLRGSEPRR